MEKLIYCDTHVIAWLYSKKMDFFPKPALRLIESADLLISPMVLLELEYLYEIGKAKTSAEKVLKELDSTISLRVCTENFNSVIRESIKHSWTRDPFDRIIVAQSALKKSALITRDEIIHKHYAYAVWE